MRQFVQKSHSGESVRKDSHETKLKIHMLKHNKEKSNIFPGKKVSIVWEANDKLAVKEVDTKILPSSTEEEFILSDD